MQISLEVRSFVSGESKKLECLPSLTNASANFVLSLANPAATGASSATAVKIHFLVINNS